MKYGCWLCQISAGSDPYTGTRREVWSHLENDHALPGESMELYLRKRSGEQTTLTNMAEAEQ